MGILAVPVLLLLLACVLPGVGLPVWGAWSSGRWWLVAAALGGGLLAGVGAHLGPYAVYADSTINGFEFLFAVAVVGAILAAAALLLAVPAVWKRRSGLAAASGALFLAAAAQPVLWFGANERMSEVFGIVFTN